MRTKLLTILFLLLPISLFSQNYEKEGDDLFAQAQYEQAEKKYKAAIAVQGESQTIKQKQDKCTKCKSLLAKAQTAEKESRYSDAAKYYSDLYAIHSLAKYQSKVNAMKPKVQQAELADRERQAKIKAESYIRKGTKRIEAKAFYYRSDIKHIVIPEGVTSIGDYAFSGSGLTSIEIPNSVISIGEGAFSGCTGLTSIEIPNSVISIGEGAFCNCSGLTSVMIGNSVTSIGVGAFSGCKSLTSVTIPNSVTSIGDRAFYGCSSLTSVEIPNSVTSIGVGAFEHCTGLTSVTIPNSVTSIRYMAFYNVLNIVYSGSATDVFWGAKSVNGYVDGYMVYSDATKTTLLGCSLSAQGEITIPNSVSVIKRKAFSDCTSVSSVKIPNSVTSIGEGVFSGCTGLTSIEIPNSVTSIGDYAFSGSGLTSVTIPNSVTSIGESAFFRCANMHIKLPERFRGKVYLSDCSKVTYYSNEKEIPSSMDATQNRAKEEKWIKLSSIKKFDLARYEFTKMRVTFDRTSVSTYCYVQIGYVDTKTTALEFAFSSRYPYYINLNRTQPSTPFTSKGKEVVNYVYEYDLNELCGTKNRKFYVRSWQENFIPEQVEILIKQERQAKLEEANRVEPEPEPEPYLPTLEELVEQKIRERYSINQEFEVQRKRDVETEAEQRAEQEQPVVIGNSVTRIEGSAFYDCTGLTSVTIPNRVTYIGEHDFSKCNIKIPKKLRGYINLPDCKSVTYY